MSSKMSLIVTLVIVKLLTQVHSFPTTQDECNCLKTHPDTPEKQYNSSQLYVFGGGNGGDHLTDAASRLNSSTGKWETINGMISAKETFCGAVVDKQIFLFGGFGLNQQNKFSLTDAAEVYNCLTDTYKILRPMPEPRNDCGAAALNGSIYVAGANSGGLPSSFIRYDIHSNQWSTLTPMNSVRQYPQLVELGGLLYAIGGDTSKSVEMYHAKTDQWSFVASTHYPHCNHTFGASVHDGKIYVFSNSGFEVYSPNNNQWNTLKAPNDHLSDTKMVTMNGELWVLGGRYNDSSNWIQTKRVYSYDPATDQWTKQHDLDVPRSYHTAFVVNH